ncbi:hypothetical protein T492DRAFT_551012 [Pavlovales sp. CCMP2436]|nr:hypothetical protein T492DRAFT_551012 [Pavlovales sp. CCMP2436]
MDPVEREPERGRQLAWQPAEMALTGMAEEGATSSDERRSTIATLGSNQTHQKDVQWKRIRCASRAHAQRTTSPPRRPTHSSLQAQASASKSATHSSLQAKASASKSPSRAVLSPGARALRRAHRSATHTYKIRMTCAVCAARQTSPFSRGRLLSSSSGHDSQRGVSSRPDRVTQ